MRKYFILGVVRVSSNLDSITTHNRLDQRPTCMTLNSPSTFGYLKETQTNFNIIWSIAAKASPYACGTRKCDLCLTEKLLIAKSDPGKMLNTRAEFFQSADIKTSLN